MKSLTTRWMFVVVALAATAVSASAQTYKAEIPMAFHAGSKWMEPGSYDFVVTTSYSGATTVLIRSQATKDSTLVVPVPGSDASKAWRAEGTPKISFGCFGHDCSLRELWTAQGVTAYQFVAPKHAADLERMAAITLTLTRTE